VDLRRCCASRLRGRPLACGVRRHVPAPRGQLLAAVAARQQVPAIP
jgi:hypothetical protein